MITPANSPSSSSSSSLSTSAVDNTRGKDAGQWPHTGRPNGQPEASGAAPARQGGTDPEHADPFGRVVEGAHKTVDRLAEGAAPHVHKLEDGVASVSDEIHHRADQIREKGDQWTASLRSTVRDNPLTAVATAMAIGMLISRITAR